MSKAIVFEQTVSAEVLRYVEVPDRQPELNEVFIRHTAIEVNSSPTRRFQVLVLLA